MDEHSNEAAWSMVGVPLAGTLLEEGGNFSLAGTLLDEGGNFSLAGTLLDEGGNFSLT